MRYWGVTYIDRTMTEPVKMAFEDKDKAGEVNTENHVGSYSTGGYYSANYYVPANTHVYSYQTTTYDNSGVACTSIAKSGIRDEFVLTVTPRFDQTVAPIKFRWTSITLAKK